MEIKTCEEYVLNELTVKEQELELLKEKYFKLLKRYLTLVKKFSIISKERRQ